MIIAAANENKTPEIPPTTPKTAKRSRVYR
jgi:hypothetical protein